MVAYATDGLNIINNNIQYPFHSPYFFNHLLFFEDDRYESQPASSFLLSNNINENVINNQCYYGGETQTCLEVHPSR